MAVLSFVLIVGALILWPVLRVRQLNNAFSAVKENDARELVLKQMGQPWKVEECGKYFGDSPPNCVEEFVYAHPYAPYVPQYWVIYFNSGHQVISDAHLDSP